MAQAKKADAEAERTSKEAALIPPINPQVTGAMPPPGFAPGGPQPAAHNGLGAAPGSVPPMQPMQPAPFQ
jgi:hypothetical protein